MCSTSCSTNCAWWLNEYRFDGFRFDGVTSMIYYDHGLERDFTTYHEYFDGNQDEDAITYLTMANMLVQCINPSVMTIAEEMSGMPGIAAPVEMKGFGFDYRMAMGVPDYWIKLVKDMPDEEWNTGRLFYELRQRRPEERVIGYCESHDQALVGDKTLMFRMVDADIYTNMTKESVSLTVDRGMALHKMIRLITFATAGGGYLTFMGNEFGHPEWIDFPREGNNFSYKNARRQWSLRDNKALRYHLLTDFEKAMLRLQKDYQILEKCDIEPLTESHNDKIVAFLRGGLLFVFNFHPANSYTGYGIKTKGRFKLILDTDDKSFGGYGHIDNEIIYEAKQPGNRNRINDPYYLNLYLPARSGQVYRKLPVKSIRDL
jgi:1,4-alpha-glucan branching enzyme